MASRPAKPAAGRDPAVHGSFVERRSGSDSSRTHGMPSLESTAHPLMPRQVTTRVAALLPSFDSVTVFA
jgi:hypothetical protein